MTFGERLIKLRNEDNISRQELADKLGIPYTTLRNYENDKREPGHKFIQSICNLFEISSDYLLFGKKPQVKEVKSDKEITYSSVEKRLIDSYCSFNKEGKRKLWETIDDMLQLKKYTESEISDEFYNKKAV